MASVSAVPQIVDNVRTASRPSTLKITDLRAATVVKAPMRCPLIRIDTNQGIYGLGEVRDGASENYALMLKSRLLGENPCNVDLLFRKIKQFGNHGRLAGGVCGVEMALMDLAGKAYNAPVYQLLGGKFRDRIRCYCDTPGSPNPATMAMNLKERIARGFTLLKMDLGIAMCKHVSGTLCSHEQMIASTQIMHPFTGTRLTNKGIEWLSDYVAAVRESVGCDVPLALDHFGHMDVESCIRLAQALDKYNLAWLEDMIPWQFADQFARLKHSCHTPICTGEDIYLKDGFKELFDKRAVSIIHPDLGSSGGIMETKKIGDLAQEHGISMAIHMAGTPVTCMAAVHCAAATENFLALENHSVDIPWWDDLVRGLPSPIVDEQGHIKVPDSPGLGIDLNDDVVREHLDPSYPGYFEPTDQWDKSRSWDRVWS